MWVTTASVFIQKNFPSLWQKKTSPNHHRSPWLPARSLLYAWSFLRLLRGWMTLLPLSASRRTNFIFGIRIFPSSSCYSQRCCTSSTEAFHVAMMSHPIYVYCVLLFLLALYKLYRNGKHLIRHITHRSRRITKSHTSSNKFIQFKQIAFYSQFLYHTTITSRHRLAAVRNIRSFSE